MSQYRIKERKNVAKVEQKNKKKYQKKGKKGKKTFILLIKPKVTNCNSKAKSVYLFSYRFLNKGWCTLDHVVYRNAPIL